MISLLEFAGRESRVPTYELKVVLLGCKPSVWRRLQVPGNASLDRLHAVLQIAIGWTNSHLHQFTVGDQCYSDTRYHQAEFEGEEERTNLWLRKLKWPHPTEAQLRKIIMGRDGYSG